MNERGVSWATYLLRLERASRLATDVLEAGNLKDGLDQLYRAEMNLTLAKLDVIRRLQRSEK